MNREQTISKFLTSELELIDIKYADVWQFINIFSELFTHDKVKYFNKKTIHEIKQDLNHMSTIRSNFHGSYFNFRHSNMLLDDTMSLQKFLNIYLEIQTENIDEVQILEF